MYSGRGGGEKAWLECPFNGREKKMEAKKEKQWQERLFSCNSKKKSRYINF